MAKPARAPSHPVDPAWVTKVKAAMKATGLNQTTLAKKIGRSGFTVSQIFNLEQGASPADTAKINQALKLSDPWKDARSRSRDLGQEDAVIEWLQVGIALAEAGAHRLAGATHGAREYLRATSGAGELDDSMEVDIAIKPRASAPLPFPVKDASDRGGKPGNAKRRGP